MVPVDEHVVDVLSGALDLLLAREDARTALGAAGRAHAEREHALDRVADAYAAALEQAAGGEGVRDAVLRVVADAAGEVGIDPDSAAAAELGARLREVRLGE
jgi:hypothetical protein